jgi:hypothetical protein
MLVIFQLIPIPLPAEERPIAGPELTVTAGYLGEMLSHPGFQAGAELSILQSGWNELSASGRFMFFTIPYYSTDLILDVGILYRCNFPFGLCLSIEAGTGYLHYFLGAKRYDYIDGAVIEIPDYGTPMWVFDGWLGLGWNFMLNENQPAGIYLKVGYLGEYPNNFGVLSHLVTEVGLSWTMGRLL